ncbi:hypothetical protein [Streptomyces sp. NPDC047070]|uniref:hypothetical protein n=1 Tax=Streptomyces sp. NPDC047070 TaxID=3154923 RepID=UPI003452F90E
MTRIRVLEAIAGADFAWAPGDVVEVSDDQAAAFADGHRAVLADDQDPGEPVPSVVHQQPVVICEDDGQELEVLSATLDEIAAPAGAEDGPRWMQWLVTVRLPSPADPSAPAVTPPGAEEESAASGIKSPSAVMWEVGAYVGPGSTGEDQEPEEPVVLFDPREHSNRQVLAYLDTVGEEEAIRVLDIEATEGEDRAGIRKQRDAVLEAARQRHPAPRRDPDAEVAADASRGGGRGGQPETRDW